ncbi:MAG: XRE family transcriptional regulator [Solirubrobacteraceae bacterium]
MPTATKEQKSRAERAKQAHRQTVESTPADVARFLQDALGQKLVAYIANVSGPRTVAHWVAGDRTPGAESEERLRAAFYIFRLLGETESSHVVRAWFAGMNPALGESAPATAIREGKLADAVAAAKAFLAGA